MMRRFFGATLKDIAYAHKLHAMKFGVDIRVARAQFSGADNSNFDWFLHRSAIVART